MDRRRFLKYTAAGVAVAGSALAGYEFDRWQTSLALSVLTRTVTETKALRETTTETVRFGSVHGRLFFDYNGNGKQDSGEPAVAGALVQLKDPAGSIVADALTDSSGDYKLEDVRTGAYNLHVEAGKKFRYACRSPDEFRMVTDDYELSLQGISKMNVGLMEGFVTLPLESSTPARIGTYHDHKIGPGAENWMGNSKHVGDEHLGTDFDIPEGTMILASVPETVGNVWFKEGDSGGYMINTFVPKPYQKFGDVEFGMGYGHLREVFVDKGQFLKRGERIGRSGPWGRYPHLHWGLLKFTRDSSGHEIPMPDAERDWDIGVDTWSYVKNKNSQSYWTVYNSPQYPY